MPNKFLLKTVALLCALSFVAAACGDDDDDDTADTGGTEETTTAAPADGGTETEETTTVPADDTAIDEATTTVAADDGGDAAGEVAIWDDGPCDDSLDPIKIGLITVFESGVLTLIDQAQALETSVEAFNARGGVNGTCYEAVTCDDGADPNQAVACAQQMVDEGVVATVNDTTSFNPLGVVEVLEGAGIPRGSR